MRPHDPRLLLLAVLAFGLAACSQGDAPQASKPAAPRAAAPQAPSPTPAPAADIDPALKERLARQEAAAKMFEKSVLQPPAPKSAEPAPAPAPAAPPKAEAKPEPRVEVAKAPVRAEPAPQPAAPKPAPAKAEPAPPPRTDLAGAKPSSAPGPAPAIRLVTRVDPDFPREAVQAGVDQGTVKARMTLDETGSVTRVEVIEANPRRVFDRAVVRALTQWRYNDGVAGRTVEAEVDFHR